jgi:hypothetical protein
VPLVIEEDALVVGQKDVVGDPLAIDSARVAVAVGVLDGEEILLRFCGTTDARA